MKKAFMLAHPVKAVRAAVKMIRAIVARERIGRAIQRKLCTGDPVTEPAD